MGYQNVNAFQYYERLARVKRHLEDNISSPFSIETAGIVANLSAKYFSAFFRRTTGERFTDWVNSVRIEHARQMISESNHSIANVAFAVGFQDLRTFERVFKKHQSMTPIAYKKAVRPRH